MSGYVRAQRDRFRHHLFAREKFCRGYAWDWLVSEARFSECRIDANGRTVVLRRGQLSHSIRFMASVWNWDKASVSRFIKRLKTEAMIETATETGQLVITICNYDTYQADARAPETPSETESETAARQQRDSSETNNKTMQEGEKDTRKKELAARKRAELALFDAEFDRVYPHYPKQVCEAVARKRWRIARKKRSFEEIAGPLREFIRATKSSDPNFLPNFGRWLEEERWLDDPAHAANRPQTSTEDLRRLGTITSSDDLAALFSTPQLRIAK